jgi:transposase
VRLLSTGHGRKNDDVDAISVRIAALTSRTLDSAEIYSTTRALGAIIEHRDDLVKTRTQTINRLHVVLAHLIPGGARPKATTAVSTNLAQVGTNVISGAIRGARRSISISQVREP